MHALALARLLQLASPTLPVGAYTYSQGLEWAVETGWIRDETSALRWIGDLLRHNLGTFELPLLARLHGAWTLADAPELARLNKLYLGSREGAELRAETVQMGHSASRLLAAFPADTLAGLATSLAHLPEPAFPTLWAGLAHAWGIPAEDNVLGYAWSWVENQVMAALKAVPLGQASGQRMLLDLGGQLPALVQSALHLDPEAWSNFTPGLALATCAHETQYSRLFRS